MLVISDTILGKVGHHEAVILTWVVHDSFEHVSISLSLTRGRSSSQDGILEPDQWLGLLPRSY